MAAAPSHSLWWTAAVAILFTLTQLALVIPGSGLGWDETVYISQVDPQAPAAFFSAPRARGISFLVAPLAVLTTSTEVLRVYLALLSGGGLFLALGAWRRLLPGPLLAGAGALFASLWITQFYGPQAMPNLWVAFAALTAVGCFLRAVGPVGRAGRVGLVGPMGPLGHLRDRTDVPVGGGLGPLLGLTASVAFAALMRPTDAAWLVLPLAAAALLVRAWRRPLVLLLLAAGLVLGSAEWIIEAYLRYGGPLARLHRSSEIQGDLGWQLAFGHQLRGLEGRALCRPCDVPWRHPFTAVWWFLLPMFATAGVLAAVRTRRTALLLVPTLTALSVAVPYLFMIGYAAPRFLLPTYALLALPVAYGLGRLVSSVRPRWRPVAGLLLAAGLVFHLSVQYLVLQAIVGRGRAARVAQEKVVAELHRQGLRSPCMIIGEHAVQVAYGAGCSSRQLAGNDESITQAGVVAAAASGPVAVLLAGKADPPGFVRGWRTVRLPDMRGLRDYRAYVSSTAHPAPSPASAE